MFDGDQEQKQYNMMVRVVDDEELSSRMPDQLYPASLTNMIGGESASQGCRV